MMRKGFGERWTRMPGGVMRLSGYGLGVGLMLLGCVTRPPVETPDSPQAHSVAPTAVDGAPASTVDFARVPDAVPRPEPLASGANKPQYEVLGRTYRVLPTNRGYVERGLASWYGTKFHGRSTSIGEAFDVFKMTAAHRTLPIPSYAEVVNLDTGKRIVVRVNDRGPFVDGRIIDLSYVAAGKLGILGKGTGRVEVRAIDTSGSLPRVARSRPAPRPPKASLPTHAADPLFVQVGAFNSRYHADRMRWELEKSLSHGILVHHREQAQPPYRVRIGPLRDREQADAVGVQLAQLGISDYLIISD